MAAKTAELNDDQILDTVGIVSGHTLKHLMAAAAAGVVVWRLVRRTALVVLKS